MIQESYNMGNSDKGQARRLLMGLLSDTQNAPGTVSPPPISEETAS